MNHYHLNLGNACNQNCIFCLVNGGKGNSLSFNRAILKLQKARENGAIYLSIDGGEPTIIPYFSKLVERSFLLGFKKMAIKTNGKGFSQYPFAKTILAKHKNDITIYLSLHGPSAEIHNKLTQTKKGFEIVLKAIKNITKLKGKVICNIVICTPNILYLKEYIALLKKMQIKEVIFLFIIPQGRALKNKFLIPKIEDTIPLVEDAIQYAKSLKITISLTFYPFCVLGKYKKDAVEYHISTDLKHFDRLYKNKYSSQLCRNCLYAKNCPKIWKEYLKIYPFVFNPVRTENKK
ncbi:MAG: radical SAM protein [Candidatus Parcubacteria bacterium]|nr:radical SAM protein [Candidatus Parcubacteria bacterium]